jgi:hypothetical protein
VGGRNKSIQSFKRLPSTQTQPRLNARTALLGLFVALTIVLASTTVYESGTRTTVTSTSTLTQIATVTSTTRLTTTSALASSVLLGNTALVLNASNELGLSIEVQPGLNGSYTFKVRVSNLLNSVNNVTGVDGWAYPPDSLDPCGPVLWGDTLEFALFQGHYGGNNYTSGEALTLYSPGPYTCLKSAVAGCPAAGIPASECEPYVYPFWPLNDTFSNPNGSPNPTSQGITTSGYWTFGQNGIPAFHSFPPGAYTLMGADEWGNVVLLQAFLE